MGLISRVSSRTYRNSKTEKSTKKYSMVFIQGTELYSVALSTEAALKAFVDQQEECETVLYCNGAPMNFDELTEESTVTCVGKLLGGKVHGSLARAGKVKGQTPKVDKEEKRKKKTGRCARRHQYNRRFVTAASAFGGRKKGPNCQ